MLSDLCSWGKEKIKLCRFAFVFIFFPQCHKIADFKYLNLLLQRPCRRHPQCAVNFDEIIREIIEHHGCRVFSSFRDDPFDRRLIVLWHSIKFVQHGVINLTAAFAFYCLQ